MKLETLFEGTEYDLLCGTLDKDVEALIYQSDKASANAVFFALRGENFDGHDYIARLIKESIEVFVTEGYNIAEGKDEKKADKSKMSDYACFADKADKTDEKRISVIKVENTRRTLALASKNFFGKPDEDLIVIGVTGTKGKTSTAYMLKAILENADIKTGIIGTVQQGFDGHYHDAENTTPQSYEIYRMMREMADGGCKALVMEVSSQALMQHRTDGIDFDIGIFTNLSPDHIGKGEHSSFEDYAYWKSRLFAQTKTAVINADSPYAGKMAGCCTDGKLVYFGAAQAENAEPYRREEILGTHFRYRGEEINLSIPGMFNVQNALAAMTAAAEFGISLKDMAAALENISVRGRTEIITTGRDFTLMLDYAHNGIALENLLKTLRSYEPTVLTAVFGCGGNRDRNRRFEMGKAAGELADFTIVTSDNPREEPPKQIIEDIVSAISETGGRYIVIEDRKKAIEYAVKNAESGSITAVCGKGHESYQIIGHEKIHFDDREIIRAVIDDGR